MAMYAACRWEHHRIQWPPFLQGDVSHDQRVWTRFHAEPTCLLFPYAPYLEHESQHLPVENHPNLGKYTSIMEHMGFLRRQILIGFLRPTHWRTPPVSGRSLVIDEIRIGERPGLVKRWIA